MESNTDNGGEKPALRRNSERTDLQEGENPAAARQHPVSIPWQQIGLYRF